MDLNFSMIILTLSCYTRMEFYGKPTSVMGGASARVDRVQNRRFMPHFDSSLIKIGGLPELLTLDL